MSRAGSQVLIIEATSHAACQGRLNGIKFDQLIFTNLGHDHLEYHGSFEAYKKAKISYLNKLKPKSVFVYNADDSYAQDFVDKAPVAVKTQSFGFSLNANACISNLEESLDSTKFDCNLNEAKLSMHIRLLGRYNAINIAAVVLSLKEYGFELAEIQNVIGDLRPVAGRLDVLTKDLKTFIFDYAHDTESLENLLQFVSQHKTGELWVLFGCTGGNRDKVKRPKMGTVAEKYANKIILTNDDPYNEDPVVIIADILAGIQNHGNVMQIVDRSEAIKYALENMQSNDVLVLAGKGGEKVIAIGEDLICFDEKQIVLDFFNDRI